MRIPANTITENQYTIGNEFMYLATNKEYQGYYYIFNDRYFTGKTYNSNTSSLELIFIKEKNTNLFLTQASTYIYGVILGKASKNLSSPKFNSIIKSDLDTDQEGVETYYAKKLNTNPILIKQISKETFQSLKSDPFYQVISINSDYSNLDEADKQMLGIKAFLRG
jgi:hypothetical protein